jgi:hypothetical protein
LLRALYVTPRPLLHLSQAKYFKKNGVLCFFLIMEHKAVLPWSEVLFCAKMVLHSKLDFDMLVRVGCSSPEHDRCLSGLSFVLSPRSQRELTGFRFGFHVSVSFDGGASWSEQVLVGKEAPASPLSLLKSGPPMLLCYSVVADKKFEQQNKQTNKKF